MKSSSTGRKAGLDLSSSTSSSSRMDSNTNGQTNNKTTSHHILRTVSAPPRALL